MGYLQLAWNTYKFLPVPFVLGYYIGRQIELYYDEQMSLFKDKSALYGSVKAEGEPPSW